MFPLFKKFSQTIIIVLVKCSSKMWFSASSTYYNHLGAFKQNSGCPDQLNQNLWYCYFVLVLSSQIILLCGQG